MGGELDILFESGQEIEEANKIFVRESLRLLVVSFRLAFGNREQLAVIADCLQYEKIKFEMSKLELRS